MEARSLLDDRAREAVIDILGDDSVASMDVACSWPDAVRKTPEWEWSAPLHFVNIPRSSRHYDRQRDCHDGQCVTEAIRKYANQLTQPGLDGRQRWQAFAWVCHLVGDLHQPLHAGYQDDRGGNNVDIVFKGQPENLHQFWDRLIVRDRLGPSDGWIRPLVQACWSETPRVWNPASVDGWTDESHELAGRAAYPPGGAREIDEQFADQSWRITREQWQKAAHRLARVLNAVLGDGAMETGD